MPEPAATRARSGRRRLFALCAVLLCGGIGVLLLRHYTQPEKLTGLLIAQARSLLGAEPTIGGGAGFAFVPQLRVLLPHPALTGAGATSAWLRADALRAVVPWSTLWADRPEIERIELVKPVLDLDALQAWLATRKRAPGPMPDLRFSLRIDDGSVLRGGAALASGVRADFASTGDAAAWLAAFDTAAPAALLPPLAGRADAATLQLGDTRLERVHVEISDDAGTATPAQQP
jgi:AsmA protein